MLQNTKGKKLAIIDLHFVDAKSLRCASTIKKESW